MEETDNPSINYNTSSNNNNSNNIIPIRVCSDCNTSKTPLWRSGRQGPKSLCNACGIRQRKARRALAIAAAAENNDNNNKILAAAGDQSMVMAPLKVTKSHHQSKDFITKKPNYNNGQIITKFKKRQYVSKTTMVTTTRITPPPLSPSPSPSSLGPKRNGVEDFLVSLSNKYLTTYNNNYHVFPQDEKEAAILLMAISCGYAS